MIKLYLTFLEISAPTKAVPLRVPLLKSLIVLIKKKRVEKDQIEKVSYLDIFLVIKVFISVSRCLKFFCKNKVEEKGKGYKN